MSNIKVNLEDLLKAGVHFGHQTSRWHPKMKPFIFGSKNNIHIINLEKTKEYFERALDFVENLAREGKTILFVGTKEQAKIVVKKVAIDAGMPYITERWMGGLFTNFISIKNSTKRYLKLKSQKETGELKKYTKKEQLDFENEIEKLERLVGGIANMENLPDAVFVVGAREENIAIAESRKRQVPIITLTDTNVDPTFIDYPIPANDDAVKSIEYIVTLVGQAIKAGKEQFVKKSIN